MRGIKVETVHSGGKFNTGPAGIYESYRRKGKLVTHTESQGDRNVLGGYGWGVIHKGADGPASDPSIEYDKSVLQLKGSWILPISTLEYRREGGSRSGPLFAAVGLFDVADFDRLFLQAVVHWPRWSQEERRDTFLDGIAGLGCFIEHEFNRVNGNLVWRITGDWNRDLKDASVRNAIQWQFRQVSAGGRDKCFQRSDSWDWVGNLPGRKEGTWNNKLYDGSLLHRDIDNIDTFLLPDNKESDHGPYKSELGLY